MCMVSWCYQCIICGCRRERERGRQTDRNFSAKLRVSGMLEFLLCRSGAGPQAVQCTFCGCGPIAAFLHRCRTPTNVHLKLSHFYLYNPCMGKKKNEIEVYRYMCVIYTACLRESWDIDILVSFEQRPLTACRAGGALRLLSILLGSTHWWVRQATCVRRLGRVPAAA